MAPEAENTASADGFRIVHEPERSRYALYAAAESADGAGVGAPETARAERLIGEAHYRLLGDTGIDFDHTLVHPRFRGTGLSERLAHAAVTGEAAAGRRLRASCWFIAEYLEQHPELRNA
ncbi:N-acetyltransferase [Leucobacter allii]|uniref:GNAT family N-acetyltransferase n=1 Tax=Leucobacter allii TaxID=2932247 RepID=UPI001FD62F37|nr:GNAT family N-acetyltransferase [Leucobacter allii]UOR00357.1 N-acetyltransferase [Leucobacter allii]